MMAERPDRFRVTEAGVEPPLGRRARVSILRVRNSIGEGEGSSLTGYLPPRSVPSVSPTVRLNQ